MTDDTKKKHDEITPTPAASTPKPDGWWPDWSTSGGEEPDATHWGSRVIGSKS
jgi:hypothetical protein